MKKRFNVNQANFIVEVVVNTTNSPYTEHETIRLEVQKALYDYFGWTKSVVRYINTKMNSEIIKTGRLIKLN
jgi:hypothetical protein